IWFTESGTTNKIGALRWVASGNQRTAVPDVWLPDSALYSPFGLGSVSPQTGNLHLTHPLDFRRTVPSGLDAAATLAGPSALVYNSDSVNVKPIIETTLASPAGGQVPSSISVQLTWNNGTPQSAVTFQTTGHSAGDTYLLAVQVNTAVTASGRYPWSVTITANLSGGDTVVRTVSGYANVVVNGSSDPFGQGWGVWELDSLVIDSNGVLWTFGSGDSYYFPTLTSTMFMNPPMFQGGMVKNADGTYTYTTKYQIKYNFDSTGKLTSITDPHSLAVTYSYSGGRLSTIQ